MLNWTLFAKLIAFCLRHFFHFRAELHMVHLLQNNVNTAGDGVKTAIKRLYPEWAYFDFGARKPGKSIEHSAGIVNLVFNNKILNQLIVNRRFYFHLSRNFNSESFSVKFIPDKRDL